MFVKTVEGTYVNLLGADTITRQDAKNGVSRFVIRHGPIVNAVEAYGHDVEGSPRRVAFNVVEQFIEQLRLMPEPMTATMVPPKEEHVKEKITVSVQDGKRLLNEALERIEDLECGRDSSLESRSRMEEAIADKDMVIKRLREELAEAKHSLFNAQDNLKFTGDQLVDTNEQVGRLIAELHPYRKLAKNPPASGCPDGCDLPHADAGEDLSLEHFMDELEKYIYDDVLAELKSAFGRKAPLIVTGSLGSVLWDISETVLNSSTDKQFVVLWIMVKFGRKAAVEFCKDLQHTRRS